jgi:hypothetical protein
MQLSVPIANGLFQPWIGPDHFPYGTLVELIKYTLSVTPRPVRLIDIARWTLSFVELHTAGALVSKSMSINALAAIGRDRRGAANAFVSFVDEGYIDSISDKELKDLQWRCEVPI